jgi:(2Fe-2S) ferredoxin
MGKPEKHIFVCVNRRSPGHPKGCCAERGGIELAEAMKKEVEYRGLKNRVKVHTSSCLGPCLYGPNMVVFPDDVWYGRVKKEDIAGIISGHIEHNRIVKKLLVPEEAFEK